MIDEGRRFGAFGAVPYKVLTALVRGLDRKIKEVYIIERKSEGGGCTGWWGINI